MHSTQNFPNFLYRCVNELSETCYVKVKINLDFIISEITFDNGIAKKMSSIIP